jgi:bilirubin oxidase
MAGDTVYLQSYASEMPAGIYGADTLGSGADTVHDYEDNFLNGTDFRLLQLNIVAATASPVTGIPVSLVPLTPFDPAAAARTRTIVFDTLRLLPADVPNRAEGPFGMNSRTFDLDSINEVVYLNTMEIWTLKNNTLVAHPFHIHDIQFNVIEESGKAIPAKQRGWKDVVLVMPMDSVKFLTRFETFTDPMVPYMYHCHLLHHEDDGMMGSFIVIDSATTGIGGQAAAPGPLVLYPNPANEVLQVRIPDFQPGTVARLLVTDLSGRKMLETELRTNTATIATHTWNNGLYLLTFSGSKTRSVHKISIQK